jgi:D-alanyl-D-alanine carboxypeptidase
MTKHYAFPGKGAAAGATRSTYQIYTENRLLRHDYPGIAGGKTGFTSLAHRTFWATATRGGHTLVVTLFQIHEPTETAARKLLDWGFANRVKVAPVGTLVSPLEAGAPGSQPTSGAVGGGGTTASGGTTSTVKGGIPWKRVAAVVLVVAVVAGVFLWWRRRNPAAGPAPYGSHEPVAAPLAPTSVAEAPVAARPTGQAAVVVPSVVVSSAVPTAPVVEDGGTAEPDAPPTPTPTPNPPRPAERPAPGGNVRIISPPGRPPTG